MARWSLQALRSAVQRVYSQGTVVGLLIYKESTPKDGLSHPSLFSLARSLLPPSFTTYPAIRLLRLVLIAGR